MNKEVLKKLLGTWYPYMDRDGTDKHVYNIMTYLNKKYLDNNTVPMKKDVFKIFNTIQFSDVRVVVLGGYPYIDGRGNGIAFANPTAFPYEGMCSDELFQIYGNIERTSIYPEFRDYFDTGLNHWLEQGIMPLHLALTASTDDRTRDKQMWIEFIKLVIYALSMYNNGTIFLLMGSDAQQFKNCIANSTSYIVSTNYPLKDKEESWSSNCFNEVNKIITRNNDIPILW